MHGGVGHGAQVDPEAELVAGKILGQRHVGSPISRWFEVPGEFLPHVTAVETLVTHPIWHAVDRHRHVSYVGIEVLFRVPGPCCEGVDEQKQDALERLALGVHPKVEAGVRASCDGHHLFAHNEVVRELLATFVRTHRLVSQFLTSYDLVLHLDIFQLVPKLGAIWPLNDFVRGSKGELEDQVVVKGLRV